MPGSLPCFYRSAALIMLLLLGSRGMSATPANALLGDWQTPGGSVVRTFACGQALCLEVVHVAAGAPVSTDARNPDPALRQRALCGLRVGTGFAINDNFHASGGHLYDPQSGKTYRGSIEASGNQLKLRGYLGISLFGRSEIWRRTATATSCKRT